MVRMMLIALSLAVISGCSTLETALSPEVRYGQVYALEEALSSAASRCDDADAAHRATYWASVTAMNIADHSRFLDEGSTAQQSAKRLVKQLSALRMSTPDDTSHCGEFASAAATAKQLLVAVNTTN